MCGRINSMKEELVDSIGMPVIEKEKLMNSRRKIILHLLLYMTLCGPAFAQVVDIPDPNLRAAIAKELNIGGGAPITQADMSRLRYLDVEGDGISSLTGLELASSLTALFIHNNPAITDLSPLKGATQLRQLGIREMSVYNITPIDISPLRHLINLTHLDAGINRIVDITPLANLTNLVSIRLNDNLIIDITPLANLKNLVELLLDLNRIVDVRALAGLTQLQILEVHGNQIVDHSPLDALSLSIYI